MKPDQLGLFEIPAAAATDAARSQTAPSAAITIAPASGVRAVRETFDGRKYGPGGEPLPADVPLGQFATPTADATPEPVVELQAKTPPVELQEPAQVDPPPLEPAPAAESALYALTFRPTNDHPDWPVPIRVRLLLKIALRELGLRCVDAAKHGVDLDAEVPK